MVIWSHLFQTPLVLVDRNTNLFLLMFSHSQKLRLQVRDG